MKLAYIIENIAGTGGLERNISKKSNYLVESYGYDLTIITIYQNGRSYAYELNPSIKVIDLGVVFWEKSSFTIKNEIRQELEKLLFKERFDICVSWAGMDMYSLYKINDGSKKVLEYHFDYSTFEMRALKTSSRLKAKVYAYLKRMLFVNAAKHYDRFVLLTKQDEEIWKRFCKNTTYIYNPLFIDKKEYPSKPADSKTVCAIGRLDYQKGYDLLIPSWKKVVASHPDWKLKIYGDGSERDNLQNLITKFDLEKSVTLCGFCTDVGYVLSQSDIFVFPSRFEGFGNVLLEAMVYGVPPVSFDCPCGPREIIENNVSGVLIDHLDIMSFLEKVIELIENENKRKTIGRHAVERSERFSIKAIMSEWNSLFNSLL